MYVKMAPFIMDLRGHFLLRKEKKGPQPAPFFGTVLPGKSRCYLPGEKYVIILSSHPGFLSARRGLFGSRPFLKTNAVLCRRGKEEIDRRLADFLKGQGG